MNKTATSNASDKIIVAFDVNNKGDFRTLLTELSPKATHIKIGMECFYSLGAEALELAKAAGLRVFLDLKLHDIPNTVGKSVYSLCRLGADMINVHALGGLEMMTAAKEAVDKAEKDFRLPRRPTLVAVTHLTSLNEQDLRSQLGIVQGLEKSVQNLAKLAKEAGLDGVVCSPKEVAGAKKLCGENFLAVTPGIRTAGSTADDQKRVVKPAQALAMGSDYIVVGRSITQSPDPLGVYEEILADIDQEHAKDGEKKYGEKE